VERNKLTLRGLPIILGYGAEVSRGHSKPETSFKKKWRGLTEGRRTEWV